jgi:ABC-type enterochelin transport system permease subunit
MEVNVLLSLTLNAVISTIIGFFIIGKILEKIKNKNKTFAAIYSFILFTIISFLALTFIDYKNNRIPLELNAFIKKISFVFIDSMALSLIVCIFFSFMILILYVFDHKK